jgi:toxin FitB
VSGFLLDTNVISELRKGPRAKASVIAWATSVIDEQHFISVLTLGEIRKGIELIRRRDAAQVLALEQWLHQIEVNFADRIVPLTQNVADQWGRLAAVRPLPVVDGLLAATALTHSLTFATRNAADVRHTGVSVLDPFAFRFGPE